jgi:hypothetical protein
MVSSKSETIGVPSLILYKHVVQLVRLLGNALPYLLHQKSKLSYTDLMVATFGLAVAVV